jgi:hypothetical protein
MQKATKLSPAVENRKGIDKDSDVSKRENGFVFVPIDRRLCEGSEEYALYQCLECKTVNIYPLDRDVKCSECTGVKEA